MPKFEVVSEYTPSGDQPEAIEALSRGIEMGLDELSVAPSSVLPIRKLIREAE